MTTIDIPDNYGTSTEPLITWGRLATDLTLALGAIHSNSTWKFVAEDPQLAAALSSSIESVHATADRFIAMAKNNEVTELVEITLGLDRASRRATVMGRSSLNLHEASVIMQKIVHTGNKEWHSSP